MEGGYTEGSSLLSGRLAGGESPPLQSPTMSTHTLGPAMRPRTPLSTRRFPYSSVPAGVRDVRSPPLEPSRPSTEDIHRRSEADRPLARGLIIPASTTPPLGEVDLHSPTTPSQATPATPRARNSVTGGIAATATGILTFLGLRHSARSSERLGEGWEEVTPPSSADDDRRGTIGLGIQMPQQAASRARPYPQAGRLEARSHSTLSGSGQTAYFDAASRPESPGAMSGNERVMTQRDLAGLVSRGGRPLSTSLRPPPSGIPSPSALAESSFAAQQEQRLMYDDVLDSPPPQTLLPPGLESQRGMWSRETILEEDEPQSAIRERVSLLGGPEGSPELDDAPPQAVRLISKNGGASSSALPLAGLAIGSRSMTPSGLLDRGESPFSIRTFDEEGERPWSGQVRQVRLHRTRYQIAELN